MSAVPLTRVARRFAVTGAVAAAAVVVCAGPAFAHVEASASKAQALAEKVTLTFDSEAESASAGFTKIRVVLPEGIAPEDVTLDKAPKGWKLTRSGDGYTVGGAKLPVGANAEHSVTVRQLPDAKSLAFKTVETYSDGKVSRWIELPDGGEEPDEPAPVLELKAAAPGATTASPSPSPSASTSAQPSPSESPTTPATPSAEETASEPAAASSDDGGIPPALWIALAAVVVALVGGGLWWSKRRPASGGQ